MSESTNLAAILARLNAVQNRRGVVTGQIRIRNSASPNLPRLLRTDGPKKLVDHARARGVVTGQIRRTVNLIGKSLLIAFIYVHWLTQVHNSRWSRASIAGCRRELPVRLRQRVSSPPTIPRCCETRHPIA